MAVAVSPAASWATGCASTTASSRSSSATASPISRRRNFMKLAERMSRIGVEGAFDVLVKARALEAQGRKVVHLEIGEPDFPTPPHIVEAAKRALDEGWTHYGPTQGYPELREVVADYVSRTRGIRIGPERVAIVP